MKKFRMLWDSCWRLQFLQSDELRGLDSLVIHFCVVLMSTFLCTMSGISWYKVQYLVLFYNLPNGYYLHLQKSGD